MDTSTDLTTKEPVAPAQQLGRDPGLQTMLEGLRFDQPFEQPPPQWFLITFLGKASNKHPLVNDNGPKVELVEPNAPDPGVREPEEPRRCLLYTSDAADEGLGVDLGGRRIIKKKK